MDDCGIDLIKQPGVLACYLWVGDLSDVRLTAMHKTRLTRAPSLGWTSAGLHCNIYMECEIDNNVFLVRHIIPGTWYVDSE